MSKSGSHIEARLSGSSGFTLLEMMFTLAVLGIVLAVGVPSFVTLTQNNRVATQTNEFVSALNLARSEAIRRGARTTVEAVQPSDGFGGGWCVHIGSGGCDDADNLLRIYPAMSRMTVDTNTTAIAFDARGARQFPAGPQLTVTIEPDDCTSGAAGRARRLDIALTGRISLTRVGCS